MNEITLKERKKCPLCGNIENVVHIPFPQIPVVRCCKCGLFYSSKIMLDEDIASYYKNSFGSERHKQGQIVNSKINSWVIKKLVDPHSMSSVLDVGTGYGFLLEELRRQYKVGVSGVELSIQEYTHARKELGLNVINESLSKSKLKKGHYDLVTSFEVIEHVSHPIEFINEMTEYVKFGGYLLIMTDNFGSRMAQSLAAGFPKWIPHSHITHFSATTLKNMLETIKELTIIKSMSYTPWEVLLRDIYYTIRGIKKTPSESFDLNSILKSEMSAKYKLFYIRKHINKLWVQLRLNEGMDGDLIYFLLKKTA